MNEELLDAAQEFDTYFISKFPDVNDPVKLISDFNTALNAYAQASTEHGEIINSITILLSNRDLEAFAAADTQADRRVNEEQTTDQSRTDEGLGKPENESGKDGTELVDQARKIVYGDKARDEAGLKEQVDKLISDLEADSNRN